MNTQTFRIISQAPAKLTLSGEHAVVHGSPALAIAVNRFTTTTISWSNSSCATASHAKNELLLQLHNFDYQITHSLCSLQRLKKNVTERYREYLHGDRTINNVLTKPVELLQYAIAHVFDQYHLNIPFNLSISVCSSIPIGCGLGSSASSIVSLIYALSHFFNLSLSHQIVFMTARDIENLQHGRSSGLDLQVVLHGGAIYFFQGHYTTRLLPKLPLLLIDTGLPKSSTGECVSKVAYHFKNTSLAKKFSQLTESLDKALVNNDVHAVMSHIKQNHKLLCDLGVVPPRVQDFIADLESIGITAKICGAGSYYGEEGGIVMAVTEKNILPIVDAYGYELCHLQGTFEGASILQ
ncbi:mevalonate kinase [Zooshikella sp. RANM57]|uniref:mevalonate kinase n=1 Tax=Zooshikella sp. RANM57 TaxID=3425863 RepID=UPI003D6F0478